MNSLKLVMPSCSTRYHGLQRLLVDAADDLVERVVDAQLPAALLVPRGEAVLHVARRSALHGEVDDGGGAAPRRGALPVSNVSLAKVPPNGSSMCVCTSMPPGMTYLPVASMTVGRAFLR
jgi:hypothetical protein